MVQENRIPFTKRLLASLPPPEQGREYWYDAGCPNLALCITHTGERTFYRSGRVHGRYVRLLLGKFPAITVDKARELCTTAAARIAEGQDPHEARKLAREEATLGELFDYWLEWARQHKRTWQEDQRQYEAFLKPWAGRRLSSITRRDVEALHATIGEKRARSDGKRGRKLGGPYIANRVLGLLRAAYTRADRLGYQGNNPAVGIEKFPEEQRDRFLSGQELKAFFASLAAEPQLYQDFFTLALLTGARRGNLQAMRWDDLDLAAALWRIPGEESKNGQVIVLPLIPMAVDILRRRQSERDTACPWVFPAGRRDSKSGHLVEPKRTWARICKRALLEDVRPHDLRRTLGSWQAGAGASMAIIGRSLGHRPGSPATAVYARLELDPVRASVETAAAAMLEAANGEEEGAFNGKS